MTQSTSEFTGGQTPSGSGGGNNRMRAAALILWPSRRQRVIDGRALVSLLH
jgi:hypothetical protein